MLLVAKKYVRAQPGSGHSDSAEWVQGKTYFRQLQWAKSKGCEHNGKIHWWWDGPWGSGTAPCPEAVETHDYLHKAFPVLGAEG